MPAGSNLKKQISSIKGISKITNAMELVSTAKLKKLSKNIRNSKQYFAEIYTVFNDIISCSENTMYQVKANYIIKKTLWIVVNSNLGLCGGYNIYINKLVASQIKKDDTLILIGTKGETFFKNKKIEINRIIKESGTEFNYDAAQSLGSELLSSFNNNEIEAINIGYTKFINNVTFQPTILALLPIVKQTQNINKTKEGYKIETDFEPDPETVLENVLPLYVNSIIYSAVIESQVSEQASRRNAMENATKNAHDMVEKLSLEYNHMRQAAITQEILEIVAGANAQKE